MNELPNKIIQKLRIHYSELICDDIFIIKNINEKWGALKYKKGIFNTYKLIIKPIYNSICFIKEINSFEVVKYKNNEYDRDENTFTILDINGNKIKVFNKGEEIEVDKFKNVIFYRNNLRGLLDENYEVLIEPKYEYFSSIIKDFFRVKNEKFGVIDINEKVNLEFKYDEIFYTSLDNKVIIRKGKEYCSFDLINRVKSRLEFDLLLEASSNTYTAPSKISRQFYKSIKNLILKENDYSDGYLYEFDIAKYKGDWGIVDSSGDVLIPNNYAFIDFLKNPKYFKVAKGNLRIEEKIIRDYHRTIVSGLKWGVIDENNNIIVPIEYDWIDEVETDAWTVFKGGEVYFNDDYQEEYWENIGGKLGVYYKNKLIVPIEYDNVKKNWFKINEYVFAQKGRKWFDEDFEYEVYRLNGENIKTNRPNPRDY